MLSREAAAVVADIVADIVPDIVPDMVPGAAPVFAALGDSTRLQLVTRLSDGRRHSISQLSTGLELSRQGVTKHLRVLENAGVVISQRRGRETRFMFAPAAIAPVRSYLDHVSAQWDQALARLQDYVESES